jgi:hypothetical protein
VPLRRSIRLRFLDEHRNPSQELELSKVTAVDVPHKMFIIEQLKDGSYRLVYSKSMLEDIAELKGLEIVRQN